MRLGLRRLGREHDQVAERGAAGQARPGAARRGLAGPGGLLVGRPLFGRVGAAAGERAHVEDQIPLAVDLGHRLEVARRLGAGQGAERDALGRVERLRHLLDAERHAAGRRLQVQHPLELGRRQAQPGGQVDDVIAIPADPARAGDVAHVHGDGVVPAVHSTTEPRPW